MDKKKKYQEPSMLVVQLNMKHFLQDSGDMTGNNDGPKLRESWDEDKNE